MEDGHTSPYELMHGIDEALALSARLVLMGRASRSGWRPREIGVARVLEMPGTGKKRLGTRNPLFAFCPLPFALPSASPLL